MPVLVETEEEQWATGGRGAWPALSPNSKPGPALMVQSGDLLDSLTSPAAAEMGAMSMSFGTDVFYAGFHQTGTEKMPARQVIPDPFPVESRRKLEREMVSWLNQVAADTWGRI